MREKSSGSNFMISGRIEIQRISRGSGKGTKLEAAAGYRRNVPGLRMKAEHAASQILLRLERNPKSEKRLGSRRSLSAEKHFHHTSTSQFPGNRGLIRDPFRT